MPYALMHMRGDPTTMVLPENTAYGDVAAEVGIELQAQAEAALAAGIEPWRILLDPGTYSCFIPSPVVSPGCWYILGACIYGPMALPGVVKLHINLLFIYLIGDMDQWNGKTWAN